MCRFDDIKEIQKKLETVSMSPTSWQTSLLFLVDDIRNYRLKINNYAAVSTQNYENECSNRVELDIEYKVKMIYVCNTLRIVKLIYAGCTLLQLYPSYMHMYVHAV